MATFYRQGSDLYNASNNQKIGATDWSKNWSGKATETKAPDNPFNASQQISKGFNLPSPTPISSPATMKSSTPASIGLPAQKIGMAAKAPEQNLKPAQTKIAPNQIKTITPVAPKTGLLQGLMKTTSANSAAPTAPAKAAAPLNTAGLAEAAARIAAGKPQGKDVANVNYAKSKGWSAPTATAAAAKPVDTSVTVNGQKQYKQSDGSYSPVDPTKAPDVSYGGLLKNLTQTAQTAPAVTQAAERGLLNTAATNPGTSSDSYKNYQSTIDKINELDQNYASKKAAYSNSGDMSIDFKQGREQVMDQEYQAMRNALANEATGYLNANQQAITGTQTQQTGFTNAGGMANTAQGTIQSGLGTAAGLAAPVQLPYSNQYVSPVSGAAVGGGALGGSLAESVSNIAQKVQNGTMSYDAGVAALGGYGQGGVNALQQALGPNFNIQASNANAAAQSASIQQTGTTGGMLTKSADAANQALDKLQSDFNSLSSLQTGGIPATNNIANWIAGALGQGALSTYQTTLHDARAQLAGVLTATGASSPTGAEAMAQTYLPDNMTPTQLREKIAAAKDLVSQKVSAFTSTSGGSGVSSNTGGGLFMDQINQATSLNDLF